MSTTIFKSPSGQALRLPVLVVQPDLSQLLSLLSVLTALKFDAIVAESFKDAKASLATFRPALLIADVRLKEFNGLHLLMKSRSVWPTLPALITSHAEDVCLRHEAEEQGATFVVTPTSVGELAAAICRTLLRSEATVAPIRGPFERRAAARRQVETPTIPNRRSLERRRPLSEAFATIQS